MVLCSCGFSRELLSALTYRTVSDNISTRLVSKVATTDSAEKENNTTIVHCELCIKEFERQ